MNKIKVLTPMGFLAIVAGVCAIVMYICGLLIPALFCMGFAAFCTAVSHIVATVPCVEVSSK